MRIGWADLKRALVPVVVAVVAAAVTTIAVDSLRFLQSADRFVRDVELSWLAPRQPQSTDIVKNRPWRNSSTARRSTEASWPTSCAPSIPTNRA
jgi:hypothetical protein